MSRKHQLEGLEPDVTNMKRLMDDCKDQLIAGSLARATADTVTASLACACMSRLFYGTPSMLRCLHADL